MLASSCPAALVPEPERAGRLARVSAGHHSRRSVRSVAIHHPAVPTWVHGSHALRPEAERGTGDGDHRHQHRQQERPTGKNFAEILILP